MKSVVWNGPEKMSVEETPEPTAEPGTVILRPEAAGICGSEIEGYLGRMGNRTPPLVMGHEFAGTVVEVGEGVDPEWQGRRVTVNPLLSCGRCPVCRAGLENVCPERTLIGIHHPGAFAEYVRVPESALFPIPDDLPMNAAALCEPFANGVHAVRLTKIAEPLGHAVVIGAGTIGLMVMQAALLSSIPNVAVVEPHERRRSLAADLGAHAVFESGEEAADTVREATDGIGADAVFDAVGASQTRRLAADLLRPGGAAVFIGLHEDETPIGFHDVVRRQITIRGSYAYTRDDFERALDWISEGRAGLGALEPVLPLEKGPDAFSELVRGPSERVKVFLAEMEQ